MGQGSELIWLMGVCFFSSKRSFFSPIWNESLLFVARPNGSLSSNGDSWAPLKRSSRPTRNFSLRWSLSCCGGWIRWPTCSSRGVLGRFFWLAHGKKIWKGKTTLFATSVDQRRWFSKKYSLNRLKSRNRSGENELPDDYLREVRSSFCEGGGELQEGAGNVFNTDGQTPLETAERILFYIRTEVALRPPALPPMPTPVSAKKEDGAPKMGSD